MCFLIVQHLEQNHWCSTSLPSDRSSCIGLYSRYKGLTFGSPNCTDMRHAPTECYYSPAHCQLGCLALIFYLLLCFFASLITPTRTSRATMLHKSSFFLSMPLRSTAFRWCLLLSHCLLVTGQQECYFAAGAVNRGPANLVPCEASGQSACCLLGDTCLSGSTCYNFESGDLYQYGCTDITYKDASCPFKCGWNASGSQKSFYLYLLELTKRSFVAMDGFGVLH